MVLRHLGFLAPGSDAQPVDLAGGLEHPANLYALGQAGVAFVVELAHASKTGKG